MEKLFNLTNEDFRVLINYCLEYGSRVTMSTIALIHNITDHDLQQAFLEVDKLNDLRIKSACNSLQCFTNNQEITKNNANYDEFERILKEWVKEEESTKESFRKNYIIYPNENNLTKENIKIHDTFNPKITFGYTNYLHEECDFKLDSIKVDILAHALYDFISSGFVIENGHKGFKIKETNILYDKFHIFNDKNCMAFLANNQKIIFNFSSDDYENFRHYESKIERNEIIIEKLKKMHKIKIPIF